MPSNNIEYVANWTYVPPSPTTWSRSKTLSQDWEIANNKDNLPSIKNIFETSELSGFPGAGTYQLTISQMNGETECTGTHNPIISFRLNNTTDMIGDI